MAEEKTNGTPDLSGILGELLANQELMSKISNIANSADKESPEHTSNTPADINGLLSDPNIIAKLPDVIGLIKPLMSSSTPIQKPNNTFDKRLELLIAMKPYLSAKRCEAIDYITKMSKIAETVKGLKL